MKNILFFASLVSLVAFSSCSEDDSDTSGNDLFLQSLVLSELSVNGTNINFTPAESNNGVGYVSAYNANPGVLSGLIQSVSMEFLIPTKESYSIVFDESLLENTVGATYSPTARAVEFNITSEVFQGTRTVGGQLYEVVTVTAFTNDDRVDDSNLRRISYECTIDYVDSVTGAEIRSRFGDDIWIDFR